MPIDDVALTQPFAEVFDLFFADFAYPKVGVVAFVYLEVLGAPRRYADLLLCSVQVGACARVNPDDLLARTY